GIRDRNVTGVQTCALPIFGHAVLAALAEMSAPATAMTLIEAVESSAPLVRWEARPYDSPTQFSHTFGEVELEVRALPSLAELEEQWRSEEHTSELQSRFDIVC